ncbi:hypothetical protein L1049_021932 [Liquidambar formosana]|uniref:Uncharacterized protein n=1 Tax=Liquidambar formosana TaxID=63359 RepID=A0AAP0RD96_LIQFO
MKKMKGFVAVESSPYPVYEDAKTRLKHQSLMQDYQELQKETEAMRNRLQRFKQKKLTLLAEVGFLRHRYKYLVKNQSLKPPPARDLVPQQKLETQRKNVTKERNYSRKEAALRHPNPGLELKQKERINNGKEAALRHLIPGFELKHKERINIGKEAALRHPGFELKHKERINNGKEAALRNPTPVVDLNQKERIQNGKEAGLRNPVPVFDLNQISREEEEFQFNCEPMRIEQPKKCLTKDTIDEQHNDMTLSVCRNIGNGSNRVGKRKISWQDQVALRV